MPDPAITYHNEFITLTNGDARLKIKKAGALCWSLRIRPFTKELIPQNYRSRFADYVLLSCSKSRETSWNAECRPDSKRSVKLTFIESSSTVPELARIVIRCRAYDSHFFFELIEVQIPDMDDLGAVLFSQITLTGDHAIELISAIANQNKYIAPIPLNSWTHGFHTRWSTIEPIYTIQAKSYHIFQIRDARIALQFFQADQCQESLKDLALRYQLPLPRIENQYHKTHPDNRSSYLFIDLTKSNCGNIIDLAKTGGFKYIMPYVKSWAELNYPDYTVKTDTYGDKDGLKKVIHQVHAEDMKFGLHHMSFLIRKESIQATPDPRLAKETPVDLINIDGNFLAIYPNTDSKIISKYKKYFEAEENDIIIDQIIISCDSFIEAADGTYSGPGFVVEGGIPSGLQAPAQIWHLPEVFDHYLPAFDSDWPDEIAAQLGQLYQLVEADFIYLDGADGQHRVVPEVPLHLGMHRGRWRLAHETAEKLMPYLNRDVLLQTSAMNKSSGLSWFYYARGNTGDYARIGVEEHLDNSRFGHWVNNLYGRHCFPAELGWFAFLSKHQNEFYNDSFACTTPDEVEYLLNRSLGHDLPIGLETNYHWVSGHGRGQEIFGLMGKYEYLRRANYFPSAMLEQLKAPEKEFIDTYNLKKEQYRLVQDTATSAYGLVRQAYLEKVLDADDQWTFTNPFRSQEVKVKITALPALTNEYEELLKPDELGPHWQPEYGSCDQNDGVFDVNYNPPDPANAWEFEWCSFIQPLNHDLSLNKVLKVTYEGYGTGEVVHIQLTDGRGRHRLYEIVMDQQNLGPREQIFFHPSIKGFYQYTPREGGVLNFRRFDYANVVRLTIYVKMIPQGADLQFKLTSIKAIGQDIDSLLRNPRLKLSKREVLFPLTLKSTDGTLNQPQAGPENTGPEVETLNAQPWEFMESDGEVVSKYDGNHRLISQEDIHPPHKLKARKRENTLHYKHEGENKALVQLILEDDALYP